MLPTTQQGAWLIIQTIKFWSQPESSLHCCIVVVSPLFLTTITCLNPNNPIVATIAFLVVHNEDPTTGTWHGELCLCLMLSHRHDEKSLWLWFLVSTVTIISWLIEGLAPWYYIFHQIVFWHFCRIAGGYISPNYFIDVCPYEVCWPHLILISEYL